MTLAQVVRKANEPQREIHEVPRVDSVDSNSGKHFSKA